jgi:tetratricopeptide (TPR) repeat protein
VRDRPAQRRAEEGGVVIGGVLEASARSERAGKLDEALAIIVDARTRLSSDLSPPARVAVAVLAVAEARLLLAIRGAEAALAALEPARAAPAAAWSVRAAAQLVTAAAQLRFHTEPALEPARVAIDAAFEAGELGQPGGEDVIDELTLAAVQGAGDAARFLTRASLASFAYEARGVAAARVGEIAAALHDLDAAYRVAEGDPDRRARALLAAGLQLRNWGLLDEALRRIERSLELRLQLEDLHGAAICQGVIAFVHQRRGDHRRERDALAADLRLCERIGSDADVPGLRARLAGALVGLGKYAAAFAEAEAALTAEDARAGARAPTRVHGFAWREQARVRLAEGRLDDADVFLDRAAAAFHGLGDAYGAALCEITRAEIALARGDAAAVSSARDRAAPALARLGAIVESAQLAVLAAEAKGLAGDPDGAAQDLLGGVAPALDEAGLGDTPVAQRARELAASLSPSAVRDDLVGRAARLPALAARILGHGTEDDE